MTTRPTEPGREAVAGAGLYLQAYVWPGANPPLVFLHPNRTNARVWDFAIAASRNAHRKVTYDERGHGLSAYPDTGYDLAGHLADLTRVIQGVAHDPVILVGQGTGGLLALLYATQHPDRIAAVVAADPANRVDPAINELFFRQVREENRFATRAEAAQAIPFSRFWRADVREHYASHCFVETPDGWRWRYHAEGVIHTQRFLTADHTAEIAVRCPVLLARGEHSETCTDRHLVELAARAPGARTAVIAASAHRVCQDNPEGFAQALDAFLTTLGD